MITIRPTAMGTEVVPMLKRLRNGTTEGTSQPSATPNTIAAKITGGEIAVEETELKLLLHSEAFSLC